MITLHDSLVEWTVLALGVAVCAALLMRGRSPMRWRGAVCTPPQPRLRKPLRWTSYWLPCVALVVIVANAGIAVNAAAAAASSEAAGAGAAAVGLGAIAALASLVVLLMVWLYLSRSVRVLSSAPQDVEVECCSDCPQCTEAGMAAPVEHQGRKRARGLTMTRLGGG
ncbi:hypothetical protein [Pseudoduganella ginsengisoli]|uniref:Uncharacterized protein n=1 Tax=Pseudoduganella ginsengisoli TaxID=1462440 RepID=A0A6L6Q8S9_9BURK|nr:hypothetical protein [Pseudoduganella ginsengisoli]MTW06187.1 hypothetical protein [Pseudoduganella ginsengisoli]